MSILIKLLPPTACLQKLIHIGLFYLWQFRWIACVVVIECATVSLLRSPSFAPCCGRRPRALIRRRRLVIQRHCEVLARRRHRHCREYYRIDTLILEASLSSTWRVGDNTFHILFSFFRHDGVDLPHNTRTSSSLRQMGDLIMRHNRETIWMFPWIRIYRGRVARILREV